MNGPEATAGATHQRRRPGVDDRGGRRERPGPTAAVVILLVALGAALQSLRDAGGGAGAVGQPVSSPLPPEVVRRAALSFEAALADVYWIRAVQLYGRTRLAGGTPQDYELLYPLLDVTTTLDPRFDAAHRLGAIFLAEPPPGGPGRPDLAVALLRKGMENAPERWEYPQDVGFVHYWWLHDVEEAARWFERAADMPGAPWWLRPLAATTLAEGGDRAGARTLWRQVRDLSGDAWTRGEATRRLAQLDALDELDRYRQAVDRFRERTGRPPGSWGELVIAGDLPGIPVDPTGVAYELTGGDGAVGVSPRSALFPLPDGGAFPDWRRR